MSPDSDTDSRFEQVVSSTALGLVPVLGAGFSHHVDQVMPLMGELGRRVLMRIADDDDLLPLFHPTERLAVDKRVVPYGDLEMWLSALATTQPHHSRRDRFRRAALFDAVAELVSNEVAAANRRTLSSTPPSWLQRFVVALHVARTRVLSFNYDTLVEATACWLLLLGAGHGKGESVRVQAHSIVPELPPPLPRTGRWADPFAESFELYKLHGSTNWFGRRDVGNDLYSIVRDDRHVGRWEEIGGTVGPPLGLEPVIVPPVADKSAQYGNSSIGAVWEAAANALREATAAAIIGYSLPATDHSAAALLVENLPTDAPVVVVNPAPDDVASTLEGITPGREIVCCSSIDRFVEAFEAAAVLGRRPLSSIDAAVNRPVSVRDAHRVEYVAVELLRGELIVDIAAGDLVQRSDAISASDLRSCVTVRRPDGQVAPIVGIENVGSANPHERVRLLAGVFSPGVASEGSEPPG